MRAYTCTYALLTHVPDRLQLVAACRRLSAAYRSSLRFAQWDCRSSVGPSVGIDSDVDNDSTRSAANPFRPTRFA